MGGNGRGGENRRGTNLDDAEGDEVLRVEWDVLPAGEAGGGVLVIVHSE